MPGGASPGTTPTTVVVVVEGTVVDGALSAGVVDGSVAGTVSASPS
jgi:hypothetical protein